MSALRLALLALLLLPATASAAWQAPADRSDRAAGNRYDLNTIPKVVVDPSGRTTAAWVVYKDNLSHLQAARRSAAGTWTPAQTLMTSPYGIFSDQVELGVDAAGTATVVYARGDNLPTTAIAARTALADQEFGPEETVRAAITDDMTCAGTPGYPSLHVAADGAATVAFQRFCSGGDSRIFLNRREAGSAAWGGNELLHSEGQIANLRVAGLPGGGALTVWEQCPNPGPGACVLKSRMRNADATLQAVQTLSEEGADLYTSHAFDLVVDAGGNASVLRSAAYAENADTLTVARRPADGTWTFEALDESAESADAVLDPAGALTVVAQRFSGVTWYRPGAEGSTSGRIDAAEDIHQFAGCTGGPHLAHGIDFAAPVKAAVDGAGTLVATWVTRRSYCAGTTQEVNAATRPAGAPWGYPQVASPPVWLTQELRNGVAEPWVATDGAGDAILVWKEWAGTGTTADAFIRSVETEPGTLANQAPTVAIDAPADPIAGELEVTAVADDADGTAEAITWDTDADGSFDDGTGDTVTFHAYAVDTVVRARTVDDEGDVAIDHTIVKPRERKGPEISFTVAPQEPKAGRDITFTAAGVAGDAPIAAYGWELDGDYDYDDATGASVVRQLPEGQHVVSVQVTDEAQMTNVATQSVTVGPADDDVDPGPDPDPDPDPDPTVTATPTPTPTPDVTATPAPAPQATATPSPPPAFTPADSTIRTAMPKLTGLRLDDARDALAKAGIQSDIAVRFKHGSAPLGDVSQTTPKAGAPVTSGLGTFVPVTLVVSIGDKKGPCPLAEAKRVLKSADLDVVLDLLRKTTCKVDDVNYKLTPRADEPELGKVAKDGKKVDLTVNLSDDPGDHDLFLTFRENPTYASFDATDWTIPAIGDQRTSFNVQVTDRAGRFVQGARVAFDTSDVGTKNDIATKKTDEDGEMPVSVVPEKGGTIDVVVSADGANEQTLYGVAKLRVVSWEKEKGGTVLTTVTGRRLKKSGDRLVFTGYTSGATARASAVDFGQIANWLGQLVGGISAAAQQALNTASEPIIRLGNVAKSFSIYPAQMAASRNPIGTQIQKIDPITGQVTLIGTAAGNVVSAGGANVVASGSANVVAAGGMNLIVAAKSGVVSAGGANVVSAGSANVVASGSANVIQLSDGQRMLAGANVVAAGSANVVASGSANVVAAGSANLFAFQK